MAYGEQIMLADKSPLFCIDGTVAHLHCRINAVHNYSDVVDEDHHVIYALARPRSRKTKRNFGLENRQMLWGLERGTRRYPAIRNWNIKLMERRQ